MNKPPRRRSERALRFTAYHEAGHAVASYRLHLGFKHVTIRPQPDSHGHVLAHPLRLTNEHVDGVSPRVRDRLEREVVVVLAGREAERLVRKRYNNRSAGYTHTHFDRGSDYDHALRLASHIVEDGSAAFDPYFRWLQARAKELVIEPLNRRMIDALAAALLERTTLSWDEAREVVDGAVRVSGSPPKTPAD